MRVSGKTLMESVVQNLGGGEGGILLREEV
jgi:hypothetical protein